MLKNFILVLLVFCSSVIPYWTWQVNFTNDAKGIVVIVDDYYLYPGIGGFAHDKPIRSVINAGGKLRLPNYNRQRAIGRKVVLSSHCGLGASPVNRTNDVIIAEPRFVTAAEAVGNLIIPMNPSGNYHITWDRKNPCFLYVTLDSEVNPAMGTGYGASIR